MNYDDLPAELRAWIAQLETTGQAVLDNAVPVATPGGDKYQVDDDVLDEFRAVLNGNATAADQ